MNITAKLKEVKATIKELGGDKQCYKTDGSVDGCANILSDESIESLVRTHASIKARQSVFNESAAILGVDSVYKIGKFDVSDYEDDIKTRIKVVKNTEKIKKLREAQAELEALITEDEKRANALEKLNSLLK
jgi:hypothetical protein